MKSWDIRHYLKDGSWNFDKMEQAFPFIKDMQNCAQNPKFHAEGNVWEHTKACLQKLSAMSVIEDLNEENKAILFLATFLHDIGKPVVSKEEAGEIVSKKHSVVGARMVRELLWGPKACLKAPWYVREAVSNLVLLHMLPVHFLDKPDPFYSVCAASQCISNKMLYYLAKADNEGRLCHADDYRVSMDTVEFFKSYCIENQCYDEPKKFPSPAARFRYFFERSGHPDFDRPEFIKGTVIMLAGLQGVGKDFVAKSVYKEHPLVGTDAVREGLGFKFGEDEGTVAQALKEMCREQMRKGNTFVFNATNTVKDIRSKWIRLFRQYGYQIIIHYVEKPFEVILKQNKQRTGAALIPEGVIFEKFAKLDVPTPLECHELILDVPSEEEYP